LNNSRWSSKHSYSIIQMHNSRSYNRAAAITAEALARTTADDYLQNTAI
jgi:hypothetical protein